jgi:hypothetical protein
MRPVRGLTAAQKDHFVPLGMLNSSPRLNAIDQMFFIPAYPVWALTSSPWTSSPWGGCTPTAAARTW